MSVNSYYNNHKKIAKRSTSNDSSQTVTIFSQVSPAPNNLHIPLERLLDYGDCIRNVVVRCSKYNEIGNPHSRKKKQSDQRRMSANKKWYRTTSYANSNSIQGCGKKEKQNFMDKQIGNIYNSYEKAKIDEQLSALQHTVREPVTRSLLPQLSAMRRTSVTTMANSWSDSANQNATR